MSPFDATRRPPSSVKCFSSQSASTSASGCAYSVWVVLMVKATLSRGPGTGKPFEGRGLSLAAESIPQPIAELPEYQAKKCAGRFFQRIDYSRTEVLLGFVDRSRQMHGGPKISPFLAGKNFSG